ncbi:MAG TPA: SMC-Scp complex subunit ScpB, partial [Elusimicrobia bacterium]|nr:SMC-Scp complex subunit ScpB [Elusimicrobiota bacterium]
IIESLLFISSEPLKIERISEITDTGEEMIKEIIDELIQKYSTSPMEIKEIAEGYLMTTRAQYAPWVRKLYQEKTTLKLSQAALETLSIIAYKQPISRAEIEEIRGVEVIAVLETLLERNIIRICGRKEGIGRPLLYG